MHSSAWEILKNRAICLTWQLCTDVYIVYCNVCCCIVFNFVFCRAQCRTLRLYYVLHCVIHCALHCAAIQQCTCSAMLSALYAALCLHWDLHCGLRLLCIVLRIVQWRIQGAQGTMPPKRLTKFFYTYRSIIWRMFSPKQLESVFKQPKKLLFLGDFVPQTPYLVSVFSKILIFLISII